MYTVGLDKKGGLILYSQLNVAKIEKINQGKTENNTSFSADETNEIIFGCLLGDGKLEMPPSPHPGPCPRCGTSPPQG